MADRPQPASDSVSETSAQSKVNIDTVGLDPRSTSFNDDYMQMVNLKVEQETGEEPDPTLSNVMDDQLGRRGISAADVMDNPDREEIVQAAQAAQDVAKQAAYEAST